MITILAHGAGPDGLPLPRWLLAYLLAFIVLLTVLLLRATSPRARWREVNDRDDDSRELSGLELIGSTIGAIALIGTFLAGALSSDDAGLFAYTALVAVFWLGGQLLALLLGDWYAAVDPFIVLTRAIPARDDDGDDVPAWTAPAMLLAFLWFWLVYGERAPTNRETALFLAIYTVAVLAGAAVWGRQWVRRGEGFAALFSLIGGMALLRRRPFRALAERAMRPGAAALASVYLGGVAFDGVSQTSWWIDIMGTRSGWPMRVVNTVGLLWCSAIIGVGLLIAARVTARLADREPPGLADRLAKVALPIGLGAWIAHELPTFLIDVQNFIDLASDPLSRGWDIFGTIDWAPNYTLLTPLQQGWIGTLAMALGAAGAAVAAHETVFATFEPRVAVRAVWPITLAAMAAVVGGGLLLLGT